MTVVDSILEKVVRQSYGRLLAYLAARSGDWSAAEDAIGEAITDALEAWRSAGIPENPEAWLLVVARRRLYDTLRRTHRHVDLDFHISVETAKEADWGSLPDERLHMLFLCAHPAIDKGVHTPLMLQAVFGLSAERIASAFLVRPSTMGQRLSRAKTKIRLANIRFQLPERNQMATRLEAVLEAVYAVYGTGWDNLLTADARLHGFAEEAIFLGRLLAELLPEEPEAHGLIALMLYCESRKGARRSKDGSYVPLEQQPVGLWSKELIDEAERHLELASTQGSVGRFQLEAAIQSVHASRRTTNTTDWAAIVQLYEALGEFAPTIGVRVGHAAAAGRAVGAEEALKLLEPILIQEVSSYQPYWALVAHLQAQLGRASEARRAYDRAIGLSEDAAVRQFLIKQSNRL